jgi:hypothetical protein
MAAKPRNLTTRNGLRIPPFHQVDSADAPSLLAPHKWEFIQKFGRRWSLPPH